MPQKRRIPSYTLHKSTGQARVRLHGKDHYLGAFGSVESKAEYDRLIGLYLGGQLTHTCVQPTHTSAQDAPTPAGPLLVKEVLASYLKHAQGYYVKRGKPTGQLERIRIAFGPINSLFGERAAVTFGPKMLRAVRSEMVRLGWTRGYVTSCVGCVVRAWAWAVTEEMVPRDAAHALRELEPLREGEEGVKEGRKVRPVPWEAVEKTLPRMQAAPRDLLTVQYLAGMRPVEACHLRACDIDFGGRVPDGPQFPGLWVFVVPPEANKNHHRGKTRHVFLGPKAQEVLKPYLEKRTPEQYLFSPAESRRSFDGRRSAARKAAYPAPESRRREHPRKSPRDRYDTRALQLAIRRACRKAGVPHWSPNQLRKTKATEIRAESGLDAAGSVLGHATLTTTLIYAEESLAKAAEAMRRLG